MPAREAEVELLAVLRKSLHNLAQPLTALQCRLWLGTAGSAEDCSPAAVQEMLHESLQECERMMQGLRAMQDQVEDAMGRG